LTDPWRIHQAQHWCRVRYVAFDLLYHAGRCLLREPLTRRRERLRALQFRHVYESQPQEAGESPATQRSCRTVLAPDAAVGNRPRSCNFSVHRLRPW
jgi:ATP-dependent DNA ligase